jgi:hypothetical protein
MFQLPKFQGKIPIDLSTVASNFLVELKPFYDGHGPLAGIALIVRV